MIGIELLWGQGAATHWSVAAAGCPAGLLQFSLCRIKSVQEDTAVGAVQVVFKTVWKQNDCISGLWQKCDLPDS